MAYSLKEKIAMAGTNQAQIAKKLGVSSVTISRVITGHTRSKRIEDEITSLTGHKFPPPKHIRTVQ